MLYMTKESKETSDLDKQLALNKIKKGGIYTLGGLLLWSTIVYIGISCQIENHLYKLFGRLIGWIWIFGLITLGIGIKDYLQYKRKR